MPPFTRILLAATAFAIVATPALARRCEYYKNGECYQSTTYVYKDGRAKSYTDPSAYKKPAEQCRAQCLSNVAKISNTTYQTHLFNQCAAKC